MKKKALEKIKKDWGDPRERRIVEHIEKESKHLLEVQKGLIQDIKKLEKLGKAKTNYELLDSLEEATYCLEAIEENLEMMLSEVMKDHLPEACNLLATLEEKVGELQ